MKFENTKVFNFDGAIRGMRNPKKSWHKSDSLFGILPDGAELPKALKGKKVELNPLYPGFSEYIHIGEADMKLAQNLIRGGSEHRKFMRQIFVSVDITAPLYWWKEFDTYKVGTTANSTSTMHTLKNEEISADLFEIDDYDPELHLIDDINLNVRVGNFLEDLEQLRQLCVMALEESKKEDSSGEESLKWRETSKKYWKELIRWLPESWLQTRTVTMTYENLLAMCSVGQRRFHRLNEWSGIDNPGLPNFIGWARKLPYAPELIFIDECV